MVRMSELVEQFVETDAANTGGPLNLFRVGIVGRHVHAEGPSVARDHSPETTTPQDAERSSIELPRDERLSSQFGPEITLGRWLADSLGTASSSRVAIIKYGVGGTDLKSDWKAGGDATNSGDGPRYVTFQQIVADGLSALASAYPGTAIEIDGMLWVQGERDARNLDHGEYAANLVSFISDVRSTYGSGLPFVIVRLSSGQTNLPTVGLDGVRAAQAEVAATDPLTALVDTDSFGLQSDNLHFDALGQQQIGSASASAFASLFPLAPLTLVLRANGDVAVSIDPAIIGLQYTLQTTLDLRSGDWSGVESKTAHVSPLVFIFTLPEGDKRRFFRVMRGIAP